VPLTQASTQVLALLSAFIEEKTGIHYGANDLDLLREKIAPKAEERGCDSLLDYYYLLRYDDPSGEELDGLIDALVVPETYFFRELDALLLAVAEFVLPLVARGQRPRIWSAACATGEEPLTLAMLLAEAGALEKVDIVATDLSRRVLSRARAGEFGGRSLRQVPNPALAERWLERRGERSVRLRPGLEGAVDFRRVNLVSEDSVAALGAFDVIFCRNVLIYFKDPTAAKVLASMRRALRPAGALFVGASESLLRLGNTFHCEERAGTFFYRAAP
jgi:chemotaxis protein methyltransferase CheR